MLSYRIPLFALLISAGGVLQAQDAQQWRVDARLTDAEAAASPRLFNDLKAALAAADGQRDIHISLAPGVYWLDDPDDPAVRRGPDGPHGTGIPYAVEVDCPRLKLIGLDPDPQQTIIAVNRGQTQGALGNYTMLHLRGDDLTFENLTLGNYCNVDLEYPADTTLSRPKRGEAIVQAQLAICEGSDRVLARNCRFISRLNLCPLVGARRTVFDRCYFESTDDALAGSAVYLHCRFTFFSSKPFYNTCPTGAILLGCHVDTHTRGTQYLTKVPGAVTLIDTDFRTTYDATTSPLTLAWARDAADVTCYQHGVTLNGAPCTVGNSANTGVTLLDTDPLLSAYRLVDEMGDTLYNVANLVAGDDGWDPLGQRDRVAELESQLGTSLMGLPVALHVAASRRQLAATDDTLTLHASLLRWGGYPVASSFDGATALSWQAPSQVAVRPTAYPEAIATSRNRFDRQLDTYITAISDFGPQGVARVTVAPYLTAAPEFDVAPAISANKKAKRYEVSYTYRQPVVEDLSTVTWYRCDDAASAQALVDAPSTALADAGTASNKPIAIRRARGSEGATYEPTRADLQHYLVAVVTPQGRSTQAGTPRAALFGPVTQGRQLQWSLFDEKRVTTDFHDLPVEAQPRIESGCWTFDAYKPADTENYPWQPDAAHPWYYGPAQDAAVGQGLVQQSRGARFFYTPTRTACRSMRVTAIVAPCKSGGQGFGSATGQYMELYIAFDPTTLTGYGLRIERTAQYDKAVTFTLMRYDHGTATPLTAPQASSCYRTSCTLRLTLAGTHLTATAETTAESVSARPDVTPAVSLEATVETPRACAFGLQHTGTVGAGATMIHYVEGAWE
jgi:hypothetical protein